MTTPSRQQLREWSAALTLGPLDPADPKETRYVALAEVGRAAVDELLATIQLAFDTTTALVGLRRELVQRHPDSPAALRDLSVSLDKVAGIQQQRGQLDD